MPLRPNGEFVGEITDARINTFGPCPVCGELRLTRQLGPYDRLSYVCGFTGMENSCEGNRFLKYIVDNGIPEPQEP